jgi:outer membrane protein TolC
MQTWWKPALIPATILLYGGVVVAQQKPHKAMPAARNDAKLQALLTQRLELLRQMQTLYLAQYRAGQATLEDLEQATISVYRADLQRKHTPTERTALAQQWVNATQDIQKMAEARVRTGQATQVEVIKAQATLVEAEIALERAKTGVPEP